MKGMKLAALTIAALVATSANAALITFDDQGFVNFDDVTDQYLAQGVTFAGLDGGAAVNLEVVDATVFGDSAPVSPPMSLANFFNDSSGLRADVMSFIFTDPVKDIEFDYNPAGSLGPNSTVNLYDSLDNLIASLRIGDLFTGPVAPLHQHVVVPGSGISRLDILQPTDSWGHYVDNLSFTAAVPAPATLLLLGAGLIGFGVARRKTTS